MITYLLNDIKLYETKSFINSIQKFSSLEIYRNVQDLKHSTSLTSKEAKIIAVDPECINWNLPKDIINSINNLKAIVTSSTDIEWLKESTKNNPNIKIIPCENYSSRAVAEWYLMNILLLTRKVPVLISNPKLSYTKKFLGYELSNMNLGIIGMGNIGKEIALISKSIFKNVNYWSKNTEDTNYKFYSLESLIRVSDVILICLSYSQETQKLITKKVLNKTNKAKYILSCTNKFLIPIEKNYHDGITNLKGFATESVSYKPLNLAQNSISLPPYAWFTHESIKRGRKIWLNNILNSIKELI